MDPELREKLELIEEHLRAINASSSLTKKNIWKSFVLGAFGALGATLGFAILLAILGFILHLFGGLPLVGSWFTHIGKNLHK